LSVLPPKLSAVGSSENYFSRVSKYLASENNVILARILGPMMADAADAGDKQHTAWHNPG